MSLSKSLSKLGGLVRRRPLLSNSLIYGCFYVGADFVQQSYSATCKVKQSVPSNNGQSEIYLDNKSGSKITLMQRFNRSLGLMDQDSSLSSTTYNWARIKRYAIFGFFFAGPTLHVWYKWLDRIYKGTTMKIVLRKLFVDQCVLTPYLLSVFYISMSFMEGKSEVFTELKTKFLTTFQTSCMFWLPVQFLNFMVIPPNLRVTFVSAASFCWANILCYLKSSPVKEFSKT